jgi:hypothetical protein
VIGQLFVWEVNNFVNGQPSDDTPGTGEDVRRIQRMKAELQAHYERFKALREAGRHEEALAQFNLTLRAAGELLETSTRVLKDVALKAAADTAPAPTAEGRVLHLPRHNRTH